MPLWAFILVHWCNYTSRLCRQQQLCLVRLVASHFLLHISGCSCSVAVISVKNHGCGWGKGEGRGLKSLCTGSHPSIHPSAQPPFSGISSTILSRPGSKDSIWIQNNDVFEVWFPHTHWGLCTSKLDLFVGTLKQSSSYFYPASLPPAGCAQEDLSLPFIKSAPHLNI